MTLTVRLTPSGAARLMPHNFIADAATWEDAGRAWLKLRESHGLTPADVAAVTVLDGGEPVAEVSWRGYVFGRLPSDAYPKSEMPLLWGPTQ